ncbi:MAG: TIGR00268 family protein, partial [Butyrivibrio sp.]|nr:TIGR00268 family protein [Butyrivibrio sp.]
KAEIRELSREMGLETWQKPSLACLASRIPYGEEITADKLRRADSAESFLHGCGFSQVRVRFLGDAARIELLPAEFPLLLEGNMRDTVQKRLHALGFSYVTLDIKGFRSGSMNEVLEDTK